MLRRPRPRPRGLAAPRSSAAKLAPPSATLIAKICQKFKKSYFPRQSPFARKALCTTGRAGPLACAAAAVYPAIHKPRPAAAHHTSFSQLSLFISTLSNFLKKTSITNYQTDVFLFPFFYSTSLNSFEVF